MGTLPKVYEQIQLSDGRKGLVVDFMGDLLIVDTVDENNDWITVEAVMVGDDFHVCEEQGEVFTLCRRKGIRLQVSEDKVYCFSLGDHYEGEYFCLSEKQYEWLCVLLNIDITNPVDSCSHYFEYHNLTAFLNAYKIITSEKFYYAYSYDAEEKTADALYRFCNGRFERYFPREAIWREMPEQRMILEEKKARYTEVSETEGMSLALLV